jgi:hypothetical protein
MAYINIDNLLHALSVTPDSIEFNDVITLIDSEFTFTPTAFTNGAVKNQAGQNTGSCKLLALGKFLNLSKDETLALFGGFFREDVLNNLNGDDHANIRSFMQTGHEGVKFEVFPLEKIKH